MRPETKFPQLLAPLIRQQLPFIAAWSAFGITPAVREKLLTISPAAIDRALKKDKAATRHKAGLTANRSTVRTNTR
jgi:hypothetical protein